MAISLNDRMTEKQLMETIRQAASLHGWLCYHTHDSRRSEPGFPDLVLCGHGRLLFWECKSAKGKTTDAQNQWLWELGAVDCSGRLIDVRIVRPDTLDGALHALQKWAK